MPHCESRNPRAQIEILRWYPVGLLGDATDEDVAWAASFCLGAIRRHADVAGPTTWEVAAEDEAQAAVYGQRLNIALADLKRRKAIESVSSHDIDAIVDDVLCLAAAGKK